MKKSFLTAVFLMFSGAVAVFATPPVIFFSDLTSGPKSGGKDNQGIWVTIVGKNFGALKGDSSVSVGGGPAASYLVWTDTKISFQLGANANTGDIVTATSEGNSNGIHFTVRAGRIFFVDDTSPNSPGSGTFEDPWRSPKSYFTAFQPGDTCFFRQGTYSDCYGNASRPYNVSFYNSGRPSGAQDNEVAWVGYPGETALFRANSAAVYNGAFELSSNNQFIIMAGLSIYGKGDGREQVRLYSSNCKLVNCRIEGIKTLSYAMIGVTASNIKIWGNECFGATSGNKLDHIVYFQTGGSYDAVDIGWNYFHDNDIGVGPVFSWNIGTGQATNIRIHDNKLDCRNSSSALRLAGIWAGGGGSIYFYNNFIIEAGASLNNDNAYNAIYAGFGTTYIYNNTFFHSRGAGSSYVVNVYNGASAVVKNNIFYNQSNCRYVNLASGNLTIDGNCYYGGAGSLPAGDSRAIAGDPRFVNAGAMDAHLATDSPCIDKGADLQSVSPRDYDGIARAASTSDLGAWEYYAPGTPLPPPTPPPPTPPPPTPPPPTPPPPTPPPPTPPPSDPGSGEPVVITTATVSGIVRDLHGIPIENVTVTLSGYPTGMTVSDLNGVYQLSGLDMHAAYTLIPSKDGYVFTPEALDIDDLAADVNDLNFTARRKLSIKGRVRDKNGVSVEGVRLELSGEISRQAVTDSSGSFQCVDLPEGFSYTVKAGKNGFAFEPPSLSTAALSTLADNWNFLAGYISNALSFDKTLVIGSVSGKGIINPDKGDIAHVQFKGDSVGRYECKIFNLASELVWESAMDNVQEGTFEWAPRSAASGIYIVRVSGPGINARKKIAVIR